MSEEEQDQIEGKALLRRHKADKQMRQPLGGFRMSQKQDYFNWVDAMDECSLAVQFERMKADVKKNIAARNKLVLGDVVRFEFSERKEDRMFYVTAYRTPTTSRTVYFELKLNPIHILILDHAEEMLFRASLALNSEGDCRYKMAKGEYGTYEGEYLRWQVIREALEPLFF